MIVGRSLLHKVPRTTLGRVPSQALSARAFHGSAAASRIVSSQPLNAKQSESFPDRATGTPWWITSTTPSWSVRVVPACVPRSVSLRVG